MNAEKSKRAVRRKPKFEIKQVVMATVGMKLPIQITRIYTGPLILYDGRPQDGTLVNPFWAEEDLRRLTEREIGSRKGEGKP